MTSRMVRVLAVAVVVMAGTAGVTVGRDPKPAEALAAYYDPGTSQGSIYRLYRAYFQREPDLGGFTYWRNKNAAGTTLAKISETFARSSEFQTKYGKLTNGAFLNLIYKNVMGRPADSGGYNYWLGKLDRGTPRGSVMLSFSDSTEYRRVTYLGVPPGMRAGTAAQAMLAALPVAAEPTRTGYDRDLFKHWDDEDGNGCDTRCEILKAEKRSNGTWYSLWDGTTATTAGALEIDHVVALAEAWDSGASSWTPTQRDRFADWQVNLTAVGSSVNQSKSDQDAAEWTPPRAASKCAFAEITVTTKFKWALSVDPAEHDALATMLQGCTAATSNPPPATTTTTTRPPTTTTTKPSTCKTAGVYLAKNGACVANYEDGTGDVDCGQLPAAMKPVKLLTAADPYNLDGSNNDGWGCESS